MADDFCKFFDAMISKYTINKPKSINITVPGRFPSAPFFPLLVAGIKKITNKPLLLGVDCEKKRIFVTKSKIFMTAIKVSNDYIISGLMEMDPVCKFGYKVKTNNPPKM